jgi:hypothetical protein
MGLDQYAYVAAKAGDYSKYWEGAEYDKEIQDFKNPAATKPREIQYWRKHPNLHGWMETLWRERTGDTETMFNGVELELTWEDLERLKRDVERGFLPETQGFFFGSNSDEEYKEEDLEFIRKAKADLFLGLKVFYNSSW